MALVQTFQERRPPAALRRHLASTWVLEVAPHSSPYVNRTVPNGSAELMCRIGEAPRVVGPRTGPTDELYEPGSMLVGVRFRPGAAAAALRMPTSELVDLDVGADELWGDGAVALGEALADTASLEDAVATLERFVFDLVAAGPEPDPIAGEAVRRLVVGDGAVGPLTSELFVSERQLRRRFRAATGLGPKTLQRMFRFQRFLALAWEHEWPLAEIARLAVDAGYADQSHLTREAARLAGRSPRTLLLHAERHCRCDHDHAAFYRPFLATT